MPSNEKPDTQHDQDDLDQATDKAQEASSDKAKTGKAEAKASSKASSGFDFQAIMNNLKSLVASSHGTPEPVSGDRVGEELEKISLMAKALASDFSKKAEECSALEKAVNALFADVEALREQTKQKEAEVAEARDAIDLREKALIKRESSASDKGAQKDADAEAKDEANDEDKA